MDPALMERLGVAGILVVAAVYMLKYFMGVVQQKDIALSSLTERFVVVTERFAVATEANTRTMQAVQESIEKSTAAVDRLTHEFREALGDAIIQGAHEAMRSAGEVIQQAKRLPSR